MRLLVFTCIVALAGFVFRASAAELSPQQEKEARKIYLNKCAKCHEFYDPKKYSEEDWGKWMVKMKKKSRLKDEQYELLLSYTADIRAGKIPVGGGK